MAMQMLLPICNIYASNRQVDTSKKYKIYFTCRAPNRVWLNISSKTIFAVAFFICYEDFGAKRYLFLAPKSSYGAILSTQYYTKYAYSFAAFIIVGKLNTLFMHETLGSNNTRV